MAKIIPVPSVQGQTDSSEFGSDTMQPSWDSAEGSRKEFGVSPFIPFSEDTFASESKSGNRTF